MYEGRDKGHLWNRERELMWHSVIETDAPYSMKSGGNGSESWIGKRLKNSALSHFASSSASKSCHITAALS